MNSFARDTIASVLPSIGVNYYHEFAQESYLFTASHIREQGNIEALNEAISDICIAYARQFEEVIDREQAAAMLAVLDAVLAVTECI